MLLKLFIGLLLVIHFLVGVFLIIVVLMQRTKEGGMGAAFGAGVTESLFGASSGNVLSKITVWGAAIFFATSLTMAVVFSHLPRSTTLLDRQLQQKQITPRTLPTSGTVTAPTTPGTATPSVTGTAAAPATTFSPEASPLSPTTVTPQTPAAPASPGTLTPGVEPLPGDSGTHAPQSPPSQSSP